MTKEQVRLVLGTPLLTDIFHADRWDYVYRRQKVNSNVLEHRKIAVYFEDGKLKRIEGDVTPAPNTDTAEVTTPESQPAPGPDTQAKPAPDSAKPAAQPGAAPAPSGQDKPQEKSWWQRLKDKF
jgi:outer membrane protein assembly factor BamE